MKIYCCSDVYNNILEVKLEHEYLAIKRLNQFMRKSCSRLNEDGSFVYQKKLSGIRFDRLQIAPSVKCYLSSWETLGKLGKIIAKNSVVLFTVKCVNFVLNIYKDFLR